MIRFAFTGLLLWLLVSCSSITPQEITKPSGEDLTYVINTAISLEPHERLGYLQEHLGAPEHTSERAVANQHKHSQRDTIRTLEYAGVTLHSYVVSSTGEEHLLSVEVRTPQYVTPEGLRIGARMMSLPDDLPVLHRDDLTVTYMLPNVDGPPHTLTVWHDEEAITLIGWEFYLG